MVPINVSSHDLQEYHFANRKLDNVTAIRQHDPLNTQYMTIIISVIAQQKLHMIMRMCLSAWRAWPKK